MAFNVTATPQSMRVQLNWSPIVGQSYFYLYRCQGAGCVPAFHKAGSGNSVLTSGLPNTFYRYLVEVYDVNDILLDTSNIVEVTLLAGVPANMRYYAGSVLSRSRLNGYDDVAISPPANGLIIAPNGTAPLTTPFLRVRAISDGSSSTGCSLNFYHWHWEISYRKTTGQAGFTSTVNLTGVELPFLDGCSYNSVYTEYEIYTEFRSNYFDLDTNEAINNSGTLKVWIDGNLLLNVTDWNHNLTSGLVSCGWGTNKAIDEIFFNGINENPTGPTDPNLQVYHDFETPFVPAASITAGLVWYDPTFNNTSGGQIGVQENGTIVSFFSGSYHAYTGVGIGVTLTPIITAVQATGTLIIAKVTSPASQTLFNFAAGGGLTPTTFQLSNGQSFQYNNLVPQSGYSILETVPTGWNVNYSVSNGSPISNISIGSEEIVTVTVTNTRISGPGGGGTPRVNSGIYKIVPQKRQDTLWASLENQTTTDVKIPNPFIKTGYVGE